MEIASLVPGARGREREQLKSSMRDLGRNENILEHDVIGGYGTMPFNFFY